MKSKDILTIVVVAIVSGVFSVILSSVLIGGEKDRSQTVEIVAPISAEFERPSNEYYNDQSINPTKIIEIGGDDSTTQPFGGQ